MESATLLMSYKSTVKNAHAHHIYNFYEIGIISGRRNDKTWVTLAWKIISCFKKLVARKGLTTIIIPFGFRNPSPNTSLNLLEIGIF